MSRRQKNVLATLLAAVLALAMMPFSAFAEGEPSASVEEQSNSLSTLDVGDILIDETTFPDPNFRAWLLDADNIGGAGSGGILTANEIATITSIDVSKQEIADLKGIKSFTALQKLDCSYNELTSLNVSGLTALTELYCTGQTWATPPGVPGYFGGSPLASLDVSGCVSLTRLECWGGQLTSLDVSGLKALQTLKCSFNRLLSLDLTGLNDLKNFDGSMQMSSLTLSRDGNRYSAAVAINANTSFDNQAVSYTNGILTSTNSAVAYSDFNAPTGLAGQTLSGVLILSYAGQPVPVLLDAPKDWSGSGTATARIDAPLADFIRLTLNGTEVDKANYSLTEGSTVITFKESYLKTLAVGTHTFTAVFAGGTVDIPLKVSAAGNSDGLPATGDSTAPLALCALLAGLGGVALVMRRRRLQA